MHDPNPLSHSFYLRDLERRALGGGLRDWHEPRRGWSDFLARRPRHVPESGGGVAFALLAIMGVVIFWT